jgi:nitroreductase
VFDETFAQNWRARYGADPRFEVPELTRFLAHRSVRKYSDRPISEQTAAALVAAAQSAATSSSLQLWSVISVQDPERREAIAELCDNQIQVKEAPWFFCFFADHHRLQQAALRVGEDPANLDYTEFFTMAVVDAALAAERMVCAAESLGMGICYIGALRNDPAGVQQFFNLPEGVFGVFGLCIGYPADDLVTEVKPRLNQDQIWFRETYDRDVSTEEYDARMRPFYEAMKMKGDYTWSARSGRRLSLKAMTGREVLFDWLRSRGMLRR